MFGSVRGNVKMKLMISSKSTKRFILKCRGINARITRNCGGDYFIHIDLTFRSQMFDQLKSKDEDILLE